MTDAGGRELEAPLAGAVDDDDDLRLPDARWAWWIGLLIYLATAAIVIGLRQTEVPKLRIASCVLLGSALGPFVAAVFGHVSLDRVVPYAGTLGVLGIVMFNVSLYLGVELGVEPFYPGRGNMQGPLLWMMCFAGVPVSAILGGVIGCVIHRRRRGEPDGGDMEDFLM